MASKPMQRGWGVEGNPKWKNLVICNGLSKYLHSDFMQLQL